MELKMSSSEINQNAVMEPGMIHLESIDRISHLPAVEQTVQAATNIYGKVKDCSSVTNWTLSTAESTVQKAIDISKPVVSQFEGPIKKVDDLLCSGLDYVEEKIPGVKLPPGEMLFQMYSTTKDYVNNKLQPTIKTAWDVMEPAVQVAKQVVEPAVKMAEPLVQPAMDTACAIKQYGYEKVGEMLHSKESEATNGKPVVECSECTENAEKPKSIHSE